VAFVIALAVLTTPALLFAHARLLRSTPAANATLTSLPTSLSLWFSEKPEVKFTVLTLKDSAGALVALGPVTSADSNGIMAPITGGLRSGKYTVSWRTAASDGHATSGTYAFSISGTAAPSPAATATIPSVTVDTGRRTVPITDSTITHKTVSNSPVSTEQVTTFSTAMRWAELVALLTLVGLVIFRLAIVPRADWTPDLVASASDRAARLGRGVIVLFAIGTISRGLAEASLIPTYATARHEAIREMIHHTRWGGAWAIGLLGLAIVIIGYLLAGKMLGGWMIAAVGLVVIAVSEALTGHSGSVRHAPAAVAADVAHLLGAGGWLGGLTAVLLCGFPALKRLDPKKGSNVGARLVRAYHNSAMECVAVVVLSAIIAVWLRFPTVSSLWTTPYGLALIRKTIFVLIVLGFGFYHWRRVVIPEWTTQTLGRFKRTAAAELVFGAVVIALTAYLLTQQLPPAT
jgi:copper transport protein